MSATNLFLELAGQEVDHKVVEIFPSQECVPVSRLDLKYTFLDLQYGNIESSSSQVKHSDTENNKGKCSLE